MKEQILEKVGAFPPLDDTVNQILAVCNNPNSSIMELTKVVEKDPMTTANILKAANSPLYGFSKEIKSIAQAVSIFGMETVKGFAFSSFLQKKPELNLSPYGIDAKELPNISQAQNAFIIRWYKGKKERLDILGLTSFLMEIGKIVLSNIIIENKKENEYKEALKECKNLDELVNVEKKIFGMTNEEIAALILEDWNFDPLLCNTLRFLPNPSQAKEKIKPLSASLKAVKSIISTSSFDKEESLKNAINITKEFGLDTEKFIQTYEEMFQTEPA